MGHWFDDLVTGLALGKLSRRSALKRALQASLAAAAESFGRADALAQGSTALPVQSQGPCQVVRGGDQTTLSYSVQAKFNGKPLVLSRTETFNPSRSISPPVVPSPKAGGPPPVVPRPPASSGATLKLPPTTHLPVGIRPPVLPGPTGPSITSTETLTLGSDLVLHSDRVTSQGSTQIKVSYGSAFQGIKESTFTTRGTSVEGDIDGRQVVPFASSAKPLSITFADGKPEPAVVIDPNLRQAITALFKQAAQMAASCKTPAANRAAAGAYDDPTAIAFSRRRPSLFSRWLKIPSVAGFAPASSPLHSFLASPPWAAPPALAAMSVAPAPPPPVGGDTCTNCTDGCNTEGIGCDAVVAAGCVLALFGYGACVAAGAAACSAGYEECLNACDAAGGACCPVSCPGGNCCDTGETCADQNVDPNHTICCPKLQVVCAGVCCASGILQCNQGICCPAAQSVCGGVCCPAGQTCSTEGICCPITAPNAQPISCHGICCVQGQVCRPEGICCPADAIVCNGTQGGPTCCQGGNCDSNGNCCSPLHNGGELCGGSCCAVFSKCCNGVCCNSFDQCINGTCCPPAQVCGGICCPAGKTCQDPKTQRCGACASPLLTCIPVDNANAPICCAPNASCCSGKCCPAGQICCNVAGVYGCHTEQVCIP